MEPGELVPHIVEYDRKTYLVFVGVCDKQTWYDISEGDYPAMWIRVEQTEELQKEFKDMLKEIERRQRCCEFDVFGGRSFEDRWNGKI